jgi:hypothetical protein
MANEATGLNLLREPFPSNQISKLPKPLSKDAKKGRCAECGGWHGLPAVHLDYVGHAALTDRLLSADMEWTWAPLALDADGLPKFDRAGGLWIKLTVCGVTRPGYGHAGDKVGGDAMKEVIGDALRNAAMRFGAALDLWHKGQLHEDGEKAAEAPAPEPPAAPEGFDEWRLDFEAAADNGRHMLGEAWKLAKPEYRTHYNSLVTEAQRETLRARAAKADAAVPA